jgi:hypothetical protein
MIDVDVDPGRGIPLDFINTGDRILIPYEWP